MASPRLRAAACLLHWRTICRFVDCCLGWLGPSTSWRVQVRTHRFRSSSLSGSLANYAIRTTNVAPRACVWAASTACHSAARSAQAIPTALELRPFVATISMDAASACTNAPQPFTPASHARRETAFPSHAAWTLRCAKSALAHRPSVAKSVSVARARWATPVRRPSSVLEAYVWATTHSTPVFSPETVIGAAMTFTTHIVRLRANLLVLAPESFTAPDEMEWAYRGAGGPAPPAVVWSRAGLSQGRIQARRVTALSASPARLVEAV